MWIWFEIAGMDQRKAKIEGEKTWCCLISLLPTNGKPTQGGFLVVHEQLVVEQRVCNSLLPQQTLIEKCCFTNLTRQDMGTRVVTA